MLNLEIQTLLH